MVYDLGSARAWLQGRRASYRVREACEWLRTRSESVALLSLYAHFFPAEWAASTASRVVGPDEAYSPAEIDFFRLVNERLFPLDEDWLWMHNEDGAEGRSLEIAFWPVGIDQELDVVDQPPGVQMLLALIGLWMPEEGEATGRDTGDLTVEHLDALAALERDTRMDWAALQATAAAAPPPLNALARVLDVVTHETGNPWLDTQPGYDDIRVDWDRASVAGMAADWRAAQTLLDETNTLLDWLAADPAHFLEVIALWKQALTAPPPRPRTLAEIYATAAA